ncbi:peptide/nickel transport system substrate-binding protein [Aliiroseovarius halocynthiae]|uniref:ABC transporter substrate-binding protein n=1 Tax=Aliiroseovarius halocynthiae TaxID=985055 RepID=A0A545SVU9_9RHOB|nr:extracellular solute-binding protein [Aliiroseovarius halocynthiae]TQV69081.1 ABC transporter substrate-binding protein [Aliiroseovarius halocynthiae]SMR71836.1 peptide/nickel transport system substrate-binding protein [Aliiroseovarius halocynthiae]
MRIILPQKLRGIIATGAVTLSAALATHAEPQHGIAMYGAPALPADFAAMPHVNPDAPKGGRIVFAESGGFDSLHPYIRKGSTPWQLRFMLAESLMGRSWDEPFTLYGLLAETIETDGDRSWVEFTLREEAAFSDGSPVTVEDVMWSYETLGTIGHPRYHGFWKQVETLEQTGPRSVKFTFTEDNRELVLLAGMRPILKKAQWEGKDFEASGIDVLPITSGPYTIGDFEPGRYLTLKRNPDYWGKDVPFMKGQANLDEIRFDYYGDGGVTFEAFKAGEANTHREFNAQKWATQFDFPAVQSGDVVLSEIKHQRPSGLWGYVMNTRNPVFADIRVRDAMIHAFNYEFINQTINDGDRKRIPSYFGNSVLGMDVGAPAEGKVRALLEPFADQIPADVLDGYALPVSDGSERNRAGLRKAIALMEDAGWTVQDGQMKNAAGAPFTFEIVLQQGANETRQTMDIFMAALSRMGITPSVTSIDSAQYKERTRAFDFDMTYIERSASLSPGNEQKFNWGSAAADEVGSRNLMGVKSPAIDAMIDAIPSAQSQEDFRSATKALDRLLMAGRYVIPIWYRDVSWIAHAKELHFPQRIPMYGDYLGFQPEIWWYDE